MNRYGLPVFLKPPITGTRLLRREEKPALARVSTLSGHFIPGRLAGLFMGLCAAFQPAAAAVLHVSPDSPYEGPGTAWSNAFHTLQGGIDAATDGDTVLVTNGTYVLTAPIHLSKAVTLSGMASTTVDGGGTVRCIEMAHTNAVVQGLTVRNGYAATIGGGIHVGVAGGTIRECRITGCRAQYGAGIMFSAGGGLLDRCVVVSNRADVSSEKQGGGVYIRTGVTMRNCLVTHNTARIGGGILSYYGGTVQGCTFSGNSATESGGGIFTYMGGIFRNCISYFNTAPDGPNDYNLSSFSYTYCCITPDPGGAGNITSDPLFADLSGGNYRLTLSSPCFDSGNNADAGGTLDLDGHPRIRGNTVNRGCYELNYAPSPVTYVSLAGGHVPPFGTWDTAATNIQAAIDAVTVGGSVWVSNGTYSADAPVTCDKPLSLLSLNGPDVTLINGLGSNRCLAVAQPDVTVEGFTLTGGSATQGGGLYTAGTNTLISNCRIVSCDATEGGGVYIAAPGAVLEHCTLTNNTANDGGGLYLASGGSVRNSLIALNGADFQGGGLFAEGAAAVVNCTIAANTAFLGGGSFWAGNGEVCNSIVYSNSAAWQGNNYAIDGAGPSWSHTCTAPDCGGTACMSTDPRFFSFAGCNYRLALDSPCIDAGASAANPDTYDLDAAPRLAGSSIDMGAYEWPVVHYVVAGGKSVPPYSSWELAAQEVSAAVDVCRGGESVMLGDGVYTTPSEVSLTRAMTLTSLNGRDATFLDAGMAHRGIVIGHVGAVVERLTVRNGAVDASSGGGGIYVAVPGGLIRRCTITGCNAQYGGGVFFAAEGGGIEDCFIQTNSTPFYFVQGVGLYIRTNVTVDRCVISDNYGPGAEGAGVFSYEGGTVRDSLIVRNVSDFNLGGGGGINSFWGGTFINCTITLNSSRLGGGVYINRGGTFKNCILYDNAALEAGPNYFVFKDPIVCDCTCVTPDPGGVGNVTSAPEFMNGAGGDFRLAAPSPCLGAGNNGYVTSSLDLDGRLRIQGPGVDMGAYERSSVHYVSPSGTHVPPFDEWPLAATNIQSALNEAQNGGKVWVAPGRYAITNAVNLSRAVTVESAAGRGTAFIDGSGVSSGFALNHTGAVLSGLTITNCVGVDGGGVCVGVAGGLISNCVIRQCSAGRGGGVFFSVNGGGKIADCDVSHNRALSDSQQGGGLYVRAGVTVDRCLLSGNAAGLGGGLYLYQGGSVLDSLVVENTAQSGGGAYCQFGGLFLHSTVYSNTVSQFGGGVYFMFASSATNCILHGNSAGSSGDNWFNSGSGMSYGYCCLYPDPGGEGNITDDPLLRLTTKDYSLRYLSPCIDKGCALSLPELALDFSGGPRPADGDCDGVAKSDMGACEFAPLGQDFDADLIDDAWEIGYRLSPEDPSDALEDPDDDSFSNIAEFVSDTNPTNGASFFGITAILPGAPTDVWVNSSAGRVYTLQWRARLDAGEWQDVPGQIRVPGNGGTLGLAHGEGPDTNAFYRVRVELP